MRIATCSLPIVLRRHRIRQLQSFAIERRWSASIDPFARVRLWNRLQSTDKQVGASRCAGRCRCQPRGPAWVLAQSNIMRSQWDGQCVTLPSGPSIPMTNQSPRVCLRWGGLGSDAGWGGVVAEAFAQPTGKPLWIVFSLAQSTELLGLLGESIALLPEDQRWLATFSTYATNLPPDADCKVRCVLAGTDDARLAPARGKVIDLSKPLPPLTPAVVTPYVLAARSGSAVSSAKRMPAVPSSAKPTQSPAPATSSALTVNLLRWTSSSWKRTRPITILSCAYKSRSPIQP